MKLGYTILYVEDVKRSVLFYQAAFDLKVKFLDEAGDFGEMDTGTTSLAFSSRELMTTLNKNPSAPKPQAPCFEIAFTTDDVASALARALQCGATLVQAPEQMPWGQTVAYVTDLDGFLVELCTPMGGGA